MQRKKSLGMPPQHSGSCVQTLTSLYSQTENGQFPNSAPIIRSERLYSWPQGGPYPRLGCAQTSRPSLWVPQRQRIQAGAFDVAAAIFPISSPNRCARSWNRGSLQPSGIGVQILELKYGMQVIGGMRQLFLCGRILQRPEGRAVIELFPVEAHIHSGCEDLLEPDSVTLPL